jgi:hypothetical protein
MKISYPVLNIKSIPSLVLSVNRYSSFFIIPPDVANDIVVNHNYKENRSISRDRVNQFVKAMEMGVFKSVSDIVFAKDNGNFVMVDGQHTLTASSESEKTLLLPVQIHTEEAKILYPKIDRGRPRAISDAIRTSGLSVSIGLSDNATGYVVRAMRIIFAGYTINPSALKKTTWEEDELLEKTKEYSCEARQFFSIVNQTHYAKKMYGMVPLSIFLTLYKYLSKNEHTAIDDFIYGCSSDDGLKKGDPRKLIYNLYTSYSRKGGSQYSGETMSRSQEMANLLLAWEHWINKKNRKIRFSTKQLDEILEDSPNLSGTKITFTGRN